MGRNMIYHTNSWPEFTYNAGLAATTMVLIPEREDKKSLAAAFPGFSPEAFLTIPELIHGYILNQGGDGLLSRHRVEVILGSILTKSHSRYLKMEQYRPSYVRALADFIMDFRKTSLEDLETAMAKLKPDHLSLKEKDLIKIYGEYEKLLPQYGYDVRSGLFNFLDRTDEGNIRRHLGIAEDQSILVYGFQSITPPEAKFIHALFRFLSGVAFVCCCDPEASEQSTRIGNSLNGLLERLGELGTEQRVLPGKRDDSFTFLSRRLFGSESGPKTASQKVVPFTAKTQNTEGIAGNVHISQANNRFQEVVSMARQIRTLAADGISLRNIRIVAPDYPLYSSLVEEVFPEYEIPYTLDRGVPVLTYPLAAVILQLAIQCTDQNPYLLRAKILSSPYVSFSTGIDRDDIMAFQENAGVELLDRTALAACIRPGSYRLDFTFVNRIRQEAFRTVKPSPGTHVLDVVRRYVEEYPELYENAFSHDEPCLGDILVQFCLLSRAEKAMTAFPARMTVSEFADAMRKLIVLFQIEANAGRDCGSLPEYGDFRKRDLVLLSRLDSLIGEMTVSFAPPGDAGSTYPLAELTRYFSGLLGEAVLYREEYTGIEGPVVSVQPVCGGQFRDWSHTFVCGLVDGEFPAAEKYNFLEPVKDGLRLGHSYTAVDYGRNRFYHLVRTTKAALFLSRPLSDNGKHLPPSPFILEAEKHISLSPAGLHQDSPPILREDNETARDRNLPVFYSQREELLYIAKNADRGYDHIRPLLEKLKKQDGAFYTRITGVLRYDGLTQNAKLSEFDGLFYPAEDPTSFEADAPCAVERYDKAVVEEVEKITFTPEVLERYAACPMRFFFDDILRLRQKDDYDPDDSDAGRLIRSLLREYAEAAAACGGVPDNARSLFREALKKQEEKEEKTGFDAFQSRSVKRIAAGLDNPDARPRGTLAAFLEYEENGPDRLSPYMGRVAGTVSPGDGLTIEVEADRTDLALKTGYLFPFLHTVAKTGDPNGIRRGLRFDLPLVIMLLMDTVQEKGLDLTVGGAGYYLVKNAKNIKRTGYMAVDSIRASRKNQVSEERPIFSGSKDGFYEEDTFPEALDACSAHILRLYELMRKGTFHLPLCSVSEQSCSNCSFSRLCRKEQLRLEKIRRNAANAGQTPDRLHTVAEIF